ncbi:glycosyltransferase [Aquirufa antheringensis]
MSVYYKESPINLHNSLYSIWDIQYLKPDQIVLVCDGILTKELLEVVDMWEIKLKDILTVIQLEYNLGLSNALNVGLRYCSFDYVARMDSDDISHPNRFSLQMNFMELRPNISILGSSVLEFKGDISNIISIRKVASDHISIKKRFKYFCPINHPSVIFNKNDVLSVGGYRDIYLKEDLDLWLRLLNEGFLFHNLNDELLYYRVSDELYKRRGGFNYFISELNLINFRYKLNMINIVELFLLYIIILPIRLVPSVFRKYVYNIIKLVNYIN